VAGREGRFEDEGWRVRKDGSQFWANVVITALKDRDGRLIGFSKVTRDLTERKRAEDELRQAHDSLEQRVRERTAELAATNATLRAEVEERRRLEEELHHRVAELAEADRHKNEFLAMLAHELRNPLAPIRNAVQILKMPGADRRTIDQAREMMDRQLQHLVRLVDDLLDVSRIMRGKISLDRQPVDLATIVGRAVETAQPVIDAHGHLLTVELPDRPVMLGADLVRLAQVLSNLLTNAAKYTERAGRIWLTATAEGDEVICRVRDTGIGIASDLLPRVFDPFVQAERSLARSLGGLGVGLTLVKRLVEMHGGTVEAHSEGLGLGSEFVVRLPARWTEPVGAPGAPAGPAIAADRARRRVLVVDDNVDAADSAAMLLRLWGHEVQTVYDGLAVLQAVRDFRPEVILLDIGLPGMTGYEVAQQLRAQPGLGSVVLAAMTGYGQDEDRRRSRAAGFNHHLTKPLDPLTLQALIESRAT
jgi:two-component system CheB/CheR fusion protein